MAKEAVSKTVPTGVKVIAVLDYISGVLAIILGLFFLLGAGIFGSFAAEQIPFLLLFGGGLFIVAGIFVMGLGVLLFLVGRGLWKAKPWARIVEIVLASLGFLSALLSIIQGNIASNIFNLGVYSLVAGYLLFNSEVKEAFA